MRPGCRARGDRTEVTPPPVAAHARALVEAVRRGGNPGYGKDEERMTLSAWFMVGFCLNSHVETGKYIVEKSLG